MVGNGIVVNRPGASSGGTDKACFRGLVMTRIYTAGRNSPGYFVRAGEILGQGVDSGSILAS